MSGAVGVPWPCPGASGDTEPPVSVTSGCLWSPCSPEQGQPDPRWSSAATAVLHWIHIIYTAGLSRKGKTSFGCEAKPMPALLHVGKVMDLVIYECFPHRRGSCSERRWQPTTPEVPAGPCSPFWERELCLTHLGVPRTTLPVAHQALL